MTDQSPETQPNVFSLMYGTAAERDQQAQLAKRRRLAQSLMRVGSASPHVRSSSPWIQLAGIAAGVTGSILEERAKRREDLLRSQVISGNEAKRDDFLRARSWDQSA